MWNTGFDVTLKIHMHVIDTTHTSSQPFTRTHSPYYYYYYHYYYYYYYYYYPAEPWIASLSPNPRLLAAPRASIPEPPFGPSRELRL